MLKYFITITLIYLQLCIAPSFAAIPPTLPQGGQEILPDPTSASTNNFSVDFYEVPIRDVARALSLQQGVSILVDPAVNGNITIHLEQLPFDDGLQYILDSINATFIKDKQIYKIQPLEKKETKKLKKDKNNYELIIEEGRLSMNAKNIDIKNILEDISQSGGLNISFDYSLRGKISANFVNIPILQGITTILQNTNYSLEYANNIYHVKKIGKKAKFQINQNNGLIQLQSQGAPITEILHELSKQTGVSIVSSNGVKGNVNAVVAHEEVEHILQLILMGTDYHYRKVGHVFVIGDGNNLKTNSLFFSKSKVIHLKYARAEALIKKLPKSFPAANLQFLENQNAIAVSGSPQLINNVENFIKQLDQPIPQIKVDVLIVEYDLTANKTFGLNLADVQSKGFGSDRTAFDFDPSQTTSLSFSYDVATTLSEAFKINLQALIEDKKAKVAANPSIWALNGNEATIDVVTEDRFRENRYNEATGRLEPLGVPRTIESGVKLKIRPWITGEDEVNLEIEPEVSSTTGTISSDDLPQTTKRKAKTVLKVKDGHTVIIGGLIQTTYENTVKRTPVLSYIPLLGQAFKNKARKEHRTELVFYITPTISKTAEQPTQFDKEALINENTLPNKQVQQPQQSAINGPQTIPVHIPRENTDTIRWSFQEDNTEIGSMQRRRAPKKEWNSYVKRLEQRTITGSLSDKVDQWGWDTVVEGSQESGFDIQKSNADRTTEVQQWNKQVDRILSQEEDLIGSFTEHDIWKNTEGS